MSQAVRLEFCCNDPDNGLFDNRIAGIQLPDTDLQLTARDMRGPAFAVLDDARLRISGRIFRYTWSKEWFGNWCWNAYYFEPAVAVELLAFLHGRDKFAADAGEERLFSMWKRQERLDVADRDYIERRLIKGMRAEARARSR